VKKWAPERGQAVWIDIEPRAGHEGGGRSPGVVLSPFAYNAKTGLALLCPVTTQIKGYPFEVVIPKGLKVSGAVLADQLNCVDWRARHAAFLCEMPAEIVQAILDGIDALLHSSK
jgi:mRNA interferase MazF